MWGWWIGLLYRGAQARAPLYITSITQSANDPYNHIVGYAVTMMLSRIL